MHERREFPKEITVQYSILIQDYPSVEKWLADLEHPTAQLLGDKRLASVEEKLDLFGGVEQVRKNLQGARRSAIILQACRQGPMVGQEIHRFGKAIGVDIPIATLYVEIYRLLGTADEEYSAKLKNVGEILYFKRVTQRPDHFTVSQLKAYETTDTGVRQLAKDVKSTKSHRWFPGFSQPKPTQG